MMSGGDHSRGTGQRGDDAAWMHRPRLREDLLAEEIEDGGEQFVDLIDPDTGEATRLYFVEYSLACGMDGQRDLASLSAWAKQELGLTPSEAEVRAVIAALGQFGYLDESDVAASPAAPRDAGDEISFADVAAPPPATPKSGPTASMQIAVPLPNAAALRAMEAHNEFDQGTATSVAADDLVAALATNPHMEALAPPLTSSMSAPAITRTRTSTATPAPIYGSGDASEDKLRDVPEGLVRGVVAARPQAPDAVEEFELGHMTPLASGYGDAFGAGVNFDLGNAGGVATPAASTSAAAEADAFGLGAPGAAASETPAVMEVPVATAVYAPQVDKSYEDPFAEPTAAQAEASSQADTWVAAAPQPSMPSGDSFDGMLDAAAPRSKPAAFGDAAPSARSLDLDAEDDAFETDTPAVEFHDVLAGMPPRRSSPSSIPPARLEFGDDKTITSPEDAPAGVQPRLAQQSLLDDDMTVSATDVQQAVRKSQMMQIPLQEADDVLDMEVADMTMMAPPPAARAASVLGADRGNDDPTMAFVDDDDFVETPAAIGTAATMYAPPVALPLPAHPVPASSRQPAAAVGAPTHSAAVKIAVTVAVLAVLAVAAFFVYKKLVLDKAKHTGDSAPQLAPQPAAPPPPLTAPLAAAVPTTTKLMAAQTGKVAVSAAVGAPVKAGDAIAKLEGYAKIEKQLGSATEGLIYDIEKRYPADIRALQDKQKAAEGAANGPLAAQLGSQVQARQAKLDDAVKRRDAIAAQLAAFVVKAPADGTVSQAAKVGDTVAAGDALVELQVTPSHTHTLTLPGGATAARYQVGSKTTLRGADGGAAYECDVVAIEGQALQLACTGPEVGAGASVIVPR
ncbi:MAG: hypothetical protein IPL79_14450 [Myxococcales bacterium]|nr:hypothetical protein [Myxococcales bacterium]